MRIASSNLQNTSTTIIRIILYGPHDNVGNHSHFQSINRELRGLLKKSQAFSNSNKTINAKTGNTKEQGYSIKMTTFKANIPTLDNLSFTCQKVNT